MRVLDVRVTSPGCYRAAAGARTGAARARGQALLILIVMMSIATVLLVYGSTTEAARAVRAEARTRAALEEARQALIGRAIADANRPGSLPCPDNDDDGSADLFVGSACPSYIGRLPWRTLGTGDLRDDGGERLWYALTPAFRDHPSAPALNSEVRGTLTVYSSSTARVVTTQGIALVFAPGAALGHQRRDNATAFCESSGKNLPHSRCAVNYLDAAATVRNASAAGPFIAAPPGDSYNDKLAVIVADDLMPLVERRVALETRNALLAYRAVSACGCYPWADGGTDGVSDAGVSRGRVPTVTALPHAWPAGVLPPYFARNAWAKVFQYSVGRAALESGGVGCTTCDAASLTFDGAVGYDVVLATSAARALGIAGETSGCATRARVLIDNVPCGQPGNSLRLVCQAAASGLSACTCAGAAKALLREPCANTPAAAECELAAFQLRGCTS